MNYNLAVFAVSISVNMSKFNDSHVKNERNRS